MPLRHSSPLPYSRAFSHIVEKCIAYFQGNQLHQRFAIPHANPAHSSKNGFAYENLGNRFILRMPDVFANRRLHALLTESSKDIPLERHVNVNVNRTHIHAIAVMLKISTSLMEVAALL